jgi:hypothetical protein
MESNQNTGEMITPEEAKTMIKAYQHDYPEATESVFLGKIKIIELLSQKDCVGIRSYFSQNNLGIETLVMVGVDVHGNDISKGFLLNKGNNCPPKCNFESLMDD